MELIYNGEIEWIAPGKYRWSYYGEYEYIKEFKGDLYTNEWEWNHFDETHQDLEQLFLEDIGTYYIENKK